MTAQESVPAHDPELLPAGTAVGEYVLDDLLGAGGFARVYQAHHAVLPGRVAIKIITRALALDAEASQRFLGEVLAATKVDHPGVVRVVGYGKLADGRAYQVMELIDGPSLDAHLDACGRLPRAQAMRFLAAIAAAIDAAHAAGIVHRDLKPANVLLEPGADGPIPRLADFGIAKAFAADENPHLTRTGTTLGTPTYMSPEQALGRRTGPASDVYSFGVVAFELLTGRVPFEGDSPLETMMMHVQEPPPPASTVVDDLGPAFDAPLAQLLAKAAEDRPATLAAAMAALRDADGAQASPPRRRRPAWAWLAAATVTIGVAVLATVILSARGAPIATPARRAPLPPAAAAPVSPAVVTPSAPPAAAAAAAGAPAASDASAADVAAAADGAGTGSTTRPAPTRPRRSAPPRPEPAGRVPAETSGAAATSDSLESPPDYAP